MGCSGEYTTGAWNTLRDRPGLSARDQGKRGPSGESNAPPIESLPLGYAGGCFVVVNAQADARAFGNWGLFLVPSLTKEMPEISAGHHHKASSGEA